MQPLEDVAEPTAVDWRRAHLTIARTMAAKYGVTCSLSDDATLASVRAFGDETLQPVIDKAGAKVAEVYRYDPSLQMTAPQRFRMHERHPNFHRLTADDLLAPLRRGLRREAAIRYALRGLLRTTIQPTAARRGSSRPPRSHRTSSRAKVRGPDDGEPRRPRPPLEASERRALRETRSTILAGRIAATRQCGGCYLELPATEFRPERRTCRACEVDAATMRRGVAVVA